MQQTAALLREFLPALWTKFKAGVNREATVRAKRDICTRCFCAVRPSSPPAIFLIQRILFFVLVNDIKKRIPVFTCDVVAVVYDRANSEANKYETKRDHQPGAYRCGNNAPENTEQCGENAADHVHLGRSPTGFNAFHDYPAIEKVAWYHYKLKPVL